LTKSGPDYNNISLTTETAMSYISKEDVKTIRQAVKKLFPKPYKFSITREHYSSVCISLMEGPEDIEETYQQLNEYYPDRYDGFISDMIKKIKDICYKTKDHFDRNAGDMGADYPGWNYHINIHIGKWDKPYKKVA
jgi:hypothetical protein